MANNAFALSPISASGELPSDADYHAISEAFMETSRGRWFLTEYARRNRNADTTMVLEAVARIENTIAAQKQHASGEALADSTAAMRDIVERAKSTAAAALDRLGQGEVFAPTQRGLRIIREVAWRLREVGYDSRICDILEDQADLIGANHTPALTLEIRAAVLDSYEEIARQIGGPAGDGAGPAAEAHVETKAETKAETMVETKAEAPAAPVRVPSAIAATPDGGADDTAVQNSPLDSAPPNDSTAEGVALDDDLLDSALQQSKSRQDDELVIAEPPFAFGEMGPEEPSLPESTAATLLPAISLDVGEEIEAITMPPPHSEPQADGSQDLSSPDLDADLIVIEEEAPSAERVAGYPKPHLVAIIADVIAPSPTADEAQPSAASSPLSLGASLLARGMVTKPGSARTDPLAPIRRMSQAEKIAFFS